MTRIRSFTRIATALLLTAIVAVPLFAARGSANFTTFVAIGDSYGAGLESGSLNLNHQRFSWPAVIARQAGVADFQQPLVSFPGIGNELQLVDIIHFPRGSNASAPNPRRSPRSPARPPLRTPAARGKRPHSGILRTPM